MMFKDRYDAGKMLVPALSKYLKHPNAIVLGLPRGGVVVAYEVAVGLHLPLDITCPRKIGSPMNPELGIGAITEAGETFFNEDLIQQLGVPQSYIHREMEKEKLVAIARMELYRKGKKPIDVKNKTVILVDDGLATGATMKAAIRSIKKNGAAKIIAAIPVGPLDTLQEIELLVDEVVCLATPPFFSAVGQFYESFFSIEDSEVIALLYKHVMT